MAPCYGCGHPGEDHADGKCRHGTPEDRCEPRPDPDTPRCRCDGYWPARQT